MNLTSNETNKTGLVSNFENLWKPAKTAMELKKELVQSLFSRKMLNGMFFFNFKKIRSRKKRTMFLVDTSYISKNVATVGKTGRTSNRAHACMLTYHAGWNSLSPLTHATHCTSRANGQAMVATPVDPVNYFVILGSISRRESCRIEIIFSIREKSRLLFACRRTVDSDYTTSEYTPCIMIFTLDWITLDRCAFREI